MSEPRLIGVDWGTTSFRAVLMDGVGAILDRTASGDGLLSVTDRGFEAVLERAIGGWDLARALPVIASGMVTSRSGWVETAYLPCPAGLRNSPAPSPASPRRAGGGSRSSPACRSAMPTARGRHARRRDADRRTGAVGHPAGRHAGTHSKWVRVEDGRITAFRTAMTGDAFAALRDHTVLKLTTAERPRRRRLSPPGWRSGRRRAARACSASCSASGRGACSATLPRPRRRSGCRACSSARRSPRPAISRRMSADRW